MVDSGLALWGYFVSFYATTSYNTSLNEVYSLKPSKNVGCIFIFMSKCYLFCKAYVKKKVALALLWRFACGI